MLELINMQRMHLQYFATGDEPTPLFFPNLFLLFFFLFASLEKPLGTQSVSSQPRISALGQFEKASTSSDGQEWCPVRHFAKPTASADYGVQGRWNGATGCSGRVSTLKWCHWVFWPGKHMEGAKALPLDHTNLVYCYPRQKIRTIPEIRGEKNAVPSCDILLDHARSAQGKHCGESRMTLPCADRSWSSMICQELTVFFSPRISGIDLFLSRVVAVIDCGRSLFLTWRVFVANKKCWSSEIASVWPL